MAGAESFNAEALSANLEDIAASACAKVRRPRCLLLTIAFAAVMFVAGAKPLGVAMQGQSGGRVLVPYRAQTSPPLGTDTASPPPLPPLPPPVVSATACGDGKCESPAEDATMCATDCPGVTTQPMCGEEPHSDPGGEAVVWGLDFRTVSAAECCQKCSEHAANPKNKKKPCNSWVFCAVYPQCWSLDTAHKHVFGECWLKWQVDASHPLCECTGDFKRTPPARA